MNQELKNDLIATWDEIEETLTSLRELNDHELIQCKPALSRRLASALHWLSKYVSEDDVIKFI